jgi:hypothetical protein
MFAVGHCAGPKISKGMLRMSRMLPEKPMPISHVQASQIPIAWAICDEQKIPAFLM